MMKKEEKIIQEAKVISIDDELNAGRIKVLLKKDFPKVNNKIKSEEECADYAFPLLPKTFQSVPKTGETVFIITKKIDNEKSQKFYLGPLISQPQFFNKDNNGQSSSVLQDGSDSFKPLKSIIFDKDTHGAFPKLEDVAVIGRTSEDLILKDGEIDLRCGIRTSGNTENKDIVGNVLLNTMSPSYIQLKYNKSGIAKGENTSANSVINMVADKINLISYYNEQNKLDSIIDLVNEGKLIDDNKIEELMKRLHQLPYGDILCEYLKIFKSAFLSHVHPYPGMPPIIAGTQDIENLITIDFEKILSPNFRIS